MMCHPVPNSSISHVKSCWTTLYSFASLLRLDAEKDYSEENSIIATKIQFWAVELARNRNVVVKGLINEDLLDHLHLI